MKRRSFLSAILAGAAAPAVVRAESLMRVVWVPHDPYELVSVNYADMLARSIRETKRAVATSIYASDFGAAPLKMEGVLIYLDNKPIALL